ncbi:MAG: NACHT domain-containing protein [Candidatus Brocadia sp.]|nr:NACHT domain-containing protein [Candidatus Brocadia sp.]
MPLKTYIEPIIEIRQRQSEKEDKFAQLEAVPRQDLKEKEDKYSFVTITFSELLKEDGMDYMIIADSGLGKTTFLKWLEVQVASRTIEPSTEYIPVFIKFTEMATINTYNDLINLIETKFIDIETTKEDYIQTKWKEGKLLFLIDGLDQVFDTAIISEKLRSKDIYGKNKVIFTSRPLGYEQNKRSFDDRYEYLRICPFDSERIKAYVQENYHEPQFQRILKMTSTLLVSRPEGFARIKTRSDLYERFIHHLIREESRRYGTPDVFAHAVEIKKDLVTVSYSALKAGNLGAFTKEEAIKYLDNDGTRLTRLLQWGIIHNLTETGGTEEIIYRHQSFQEYLASLKLKEKIFKNSKIKEEVIIDHLEYLYCDEVWLFLIGGLEREQAREIINYLRKYDHYLAALCLRAYKGNREDFKALIDGLFKEIHNFKARDVLVKIADTEVETKWIGLLQDEYAYVRGDAAEALREIKSEKAVEALIGLLKDEDARVRMRAAEALGEIKSEKAVEALIGLLKDEDAYVCESATVALGNISLMLNSSDQDKLILQLSTLSHEKDIPSHYKYIDAIEQIKKATGRRFLRIIHSHP